MNPIFEGILRKGIEKIELPFQVRRLRLEDIIEILLVQEQVYTQLENKDVLQPLTKEEYDTILNGAGLLIGAFVAGELIAFRAVVVPPKDEEHLGLDIGLTWEELDKVIYQEISNVLPEYRGNGLQKLLAQIIMSELSKQEQLFQYVCCTVAPFNIASLKDKFSQGMTIAALKQKYGNLLRYIFRKDIKETKMDSWQDITKFKMADVSGQKEILKAGWLGFKMEEIDNEWWIYFGREA